MAVIPFPAPEPEPEIFPLSLLGDITNIVEGIFGNLESLGQKLIDTYGEKTVSEFLDDVKDKPIKDLLKDLL